MFRLIALLNILLISLTAMPPANAQNNSVVTQETADLFNNVFVTAGYSAALGAAASAALLVFFPNPQQNLKFVVAGASAGFVAGGLYGVYRLQQFSKNPESGYPGQDDFGQIPPTQPVSELRPEAPLRSALINHRSHSTSIDIPRFAVSSDGIALHLVQFRY